MAKTGIFYGSSTGNTENAAEKIKGLIGGADITNIKSASVEEMKQYDNLILGSSTWGLGELQEDWEDIIIKLQQEDLSGKKVALFGTGDQESYSETFADAVGLLYEALRDSGAEIVGAWPSEGYEYSESKAEKEGMFVGLVLDEDNQADMTDDRIEEWVSGLKKDF
jgi:flavodoxin I